MRGKTSNMILNHLSYTRVGLFGILIAEGIPSPLWYIYLSPAQPSPIQSI